MKPLLSICIPTYNREPLLKECLNSLVQQFTDLNIYHKTEIIISDNNSPDNTQKLVYAFQKKYKNIVYHKRTKTVQADYNIIHSASYASGFYLWFFSDDDLHYPYSLSTIIKITENHHPDAIICNLDLYSKNGRKIIDRNLLRLNKDLKVKTKKELFSFLESKFFTPLDWYYTCISNTIVSRKIYRDNLKKVMKLYDPHSNNFLHSGLIYYNYCDYFIYFLQESLGKFRTDNRLFGPDEKTHQAEYLLFLYTILKRHNDLVYQYNKLSMSLKFKLLLFLKNTSREVRRILVKKTGYDISELLLKLFPHA